MEHSIATHNGDIIVDKVSADVVDRAQFVIHTQGPDEWRPGVRLISEHVPSTLSERYYEETGKTYTSGHPEYNTTFGEVTNAGIRVWKKFRGTNGTRSVTEQFAQMLERPADFKALAQKKGFSLEFNFDIQCRKCNGTLDTANEIKSGAHTECPSE